MRGARGGCRGAPPLRRALVARGSAGARGGPVDVAARACVCGRGAASHSACCPGGCPASAAAG
eukprot:2183488-Alexandrium_andersonii.AAC.1